jgi:predicted ATPase
VTFIRHIEVKGLFGLYDHTIDVRARPRVTVVAGPNGIGKSTVLSLAQALMRGDMRELGKHEFEEFAVEMQDGHRLSVRPIEPTEDLEETGKKLQIVLRKKDEVVKEGQFDALRASSELALPPSVEEHGPDLFYDQRSDEYMTLQEVEMRFGRPQRLNKRTVREQAHWLDQVTEDWRVDFIETKRLDTFMTRVRRQRGVRRRDGEAAPIQIYLQEVAASLGAAQRQSDRTRQIQDRTFARRMLSKGSKLSVKEPILRERYATLTAEAETLAENGLLTDSLEVLSEEKLTPTDKRILKLFLDDFEAKLKPLKPMSDRVEKLKAVIGSKFLNKRIEIDPQQGVEFYSEPDDKPIAPESLSSGEQHALALTSRLLFREAEGTTVLIDEPELSLHVGWQHEMITDLVEIARIANLSFVLATHSTAIINGRWDLVEELGALDPEHPGHEEVGDSGS